MVAKEVEMPVCPLLSVDVIGSVSSKMKSVTWTDRQSILR
jgi:hypothetical protein